VDLKRLDDAALHERKLAGCDGRDTHSPYNFVVESATRCSELSHVFLQFAHKNA